VITSNDSFKLSSPLNGHMSKFALLCQAARLLGQILNHISSEAIDVRRHDEDDIQLNRTIIAMINASEALESPDYDQIAFCYWYIFASNHGPCSLLNMAQFSHCPTPVLHFAR
jgi:hypothetical protein